MARNFILTTDSTTDFPESYYAEHNIPMIPLSVTVDGVTYTGEEGSKIDIKDFYNAMRAGSTPTTAQINLENATKFFEGFLADGHDILHIAFSSGLSGTYNTMSVAANDLKEKYPDRKIYVVDSKAASLGQGLLVYYVCQKADSGADIEEVYNYTEKLKDNICHYFTVEDLVYLHRGGRVSKAAMIFGSMLGIKPVLHVDMEGHLIPIAKVRGRKQSLNALVDNMAAKIGSNENNIFFVSHGDSIDDANYVAELVKKRFSIKECIINDVGSVIGSHSGPGTIALFFVGDGKAIEK